MDIQGMRRILLACCEFFCMEEVDHYHLRSVSAAICSHSYHSSNTFSSIKPRTSLSSPLAINTPHVAKRPQHNLSPLLHIPSSC